MAWLLHILAAPRKSNWLFIGPRLMLQYTRQELCPCSLSSSAQAVGVIISGIFC